MALATPLAAQETAEIVVTANKREERLIDTSQAITVYSREFIEDARIRSLRQIDDYAPNVSINQLGQIGGTYISIRGIESNPFIVNRAAVYIDGIPFRDIDAQVLNDAAQIEVLRGPQGTLYGANANAGIVLVRTLEPGDALEGYASTTVNSFSNGETFNYRARAAGPITDTLGAAMSLSYEHGNTFVRNDGSSLGLTGRLRDFAGTTRFRFVPTSATRIDVLGYVTRLTAPGVYEQEFAPLDRTVYDRNYRSSFNGGRAVARFGIVNDAPKRTTENEWGAGATIVQGLGAAELTLAASYRDERSTAFGTDLDLTALTAAAGGDVNRNSFLNIEGRLASTAREGLRWVAGINYYRERKQQTLSTLAGPGGFANFSPAPPQSARADDVAVFGQVTIPFDRFELDVGGRYDRARRGREQQAGVLNLGPLGQFTFVAVNERGTFEEFVPKVALAYKIDENTRLYATVAKGWLPGGFNLEASRFGAASIFGRFGEERLWSYEIGGKAQLAGGRIFIGAAAFIIDADQWQEFNVLTSPTGQVLSTNLITSNAAIRSKGVEFELQARPTRELTLTFAAGYIDAKYTQYRFSPTQDFTGNRVKLVPEFDLSATAKYKHPSGLFVRGEASVTGKTALNADNTAIQSAVARLGLQFGYETERLSIRAFGNNLANVRTASGQAYSNFLFGNDGTFYAPLGDPRVIGVEAQVNF
ncbi:MAG: TonB-dependent receptor [Sphingomonadaceae bacterium]